MNALRVLWLAALALPAVAAHSTLRLEKIEQVLEEVPAGQTLPMCFERDDAPHTLRTLPSARWIHCGVPKVACTQMWTLLEILRNASHISPHFPDGKVNVRDLLTLSELFDAFGRPSTRWAISVFLRDPLERLLSAYEDKVARETYLTKSLHAGGAPLAWDEFLHRWLRAHNANDAEYSAHASQVMRSDPHIRSQFDLCGLRHFLPAYNFVALFDRVRERMPDLLRRINGAAGAHHAAFGPNRHEELFGAAHEPRAHQDFVRFFNRSTVTRLLATPVIAEQVLVLKEIAQATRSSARPQRRFRLVRQTPMFEQHFEDPGTDATLSGLLAEARDAYMQPARLAPRLFP